MVLEALVSAMAAMAWAMVWEVCTAMVYMADTFGDALQTTERLLHQGRRGLRSHSMALAMAGMAWEGWDMALAMAMAWADSMAMDSMAATSGGDQQRRGALGRRRGVQSLGASVAMAMVAMVTMAMAMATMATATTTTMTTTTTGDHCQHHAPAEEDTAQ